MNSLITTNTIEPEVIDWMTNDPEEERQEELLLQQDIEDIKLKYSELKNNELMCKSAGKRSLELAIYIGGVVLPYRKGEKETKTWRKWCDKNITGNLPDLSYQTITRYIQLYQFNVSHVTDMEECESIREAYHKFDIVRLKSKGPENREPMPLNFPDEHETPQPEEPIQEIPKDPFQEMLRLEEELRKLYVENERHQDYVEMVKLLKPLVKIYNKHHHEETEVTVNGLEVVQNETYTGN